jgi:murein DD-endopeptidase MepM/ murein hydrolase activator NlpD
VGVRGGPGDFSPVSGAARDGSRSTSARPGFILAGLLAFFAYALVAWPGGGSKPPPVVHGPAGDEPVIMEMAQAQVPPITVYDHKVKSGDTLYAILKDAGLPEASILTVGSSRVEGVNPSRLIKGRPYRLISEDGRVTEYQYEPDDDNILRVVLAEDPPLVEVVPIPYEIRTVTVSGTIEDSLFMAVDRIGEQPALALDLADIFAWQVDFFRDLRKGDTFRVVVEKYYRGGEMVKYGRIAAARFVNRGETFNAFRFSPGGGRADYFDEKGDSLRKQFLKAPLRFRRISSGFSRRRPHPVTGKVRPHNGVDYAAPTGTPVMAIGDGKIVVRKKDSVNGKWIKIRHNSVYSSAYLHLNGFASGTRTGSKVKQGQVIGYLGATGRTTGPHLHFVMYRNGKYVNPGRVNVPRASAVPKDIMEAYDQLVSSLSALLDLPAADEPGTYTEVADALR